MELYIHDLKYQIISFELDFSPEELLRKNKEYFYDKRLEIKDFLPDPTIFKKFYERNSTSNPKILEDAAVYALSLVLLKYNLTKTQPELGKEVIINPFGSDTTRGKGEWIWRFHKISGKGNFSTDIDRILWIVNKDKSRILYNCQIYNPQKSNFNTLKKLTEKNRQLRPIEYQKNILSESEIIFFINDDLKINQDSIFSEVKKFKYHYSEEIRPNTNFNIIFWINNTIKTYRTKL
ncbi:hypothetical protein [Leptospira jelokensis]|uniref:hypothetical protein n=1 Tax=Leptospira jelokensis TaxID=2484931 RepID=UPI0010911D34|nr:hypothetical protein [Leptospira jelokensis]TGM03840.1 hypothetical protein EHQ79_05960 [Leptospira jelokensis]